MALLDIIVSSLSLDLGPSWSLIPAKGQEVMDLKWSVKALTYKDTLSYKKQTKNKQANNKTLHIRK